MVELHRQHKPKASTELLISPGAIVVVHDEGLPRGGWKLGKVEKVLPGRDGQIRGAVVRLGTRSTVIRRPVQLLYPLEVQETTEGSDQPMTTDIGSIASDQSTAPQLSTEADE